MKDKVKNYLSNDDEKQLWERLYSAFQEGGENRIEKEIEKEKQKISEEFKKFKKEIENKLEV